MRDKIERIFAAEFGAAANPIIVRSPGRVNIIGEHTDYNNGFVLPAAIDKAAYLAISAREDDEIHLRAHDLQESFSISINHLKPVAEKGWPNYILGAVAQFIKKGIQLKGFNALLTSDVPMGAGLSSSAAVECATVFALNELLKTNIGKEEMIRMAQKAEHEYAGVMCGIMDQFASVMGKKDHVIKLDCRSLAYEYVPFKLDGIKVVLLNTNVKHSLASSEYNTRRKECEQGVEWIKEFVPSVNSLRDVSVEMLDKYVKGRDELVYKRCLFVVEEIERLQTACNDLGAGDIASLGEKMFATHEGLSKQYEVSCTELDFLVNHVKNNPDVIGARMMGGGFGGCSINLVKEDAIDKLVADITPAYEKATGLTLSYYVASIEDGTMTI
ncbi:MAG TPA: galactokinase [Chitinophagaceae bacterium]